MILILTKKFEIVSISGTHFHTNVKKLTVSFLVRVVSSRDLNFKKLINLKLE